MKNWTSVVPSFSISRSFQFGFFLILAVFFNFNLVDDRFVSPLEDLDYQYQSYEFEETTRILVVAKKNHLSEKTVSVDSNSRFIPRTGELSFPNPVVFFILKEILLQFGFISLPPPYLA